MKRVVRLAILMVGTAMMVTATAQQPPSAAERAQFMIDVRQGVVNILAWNIGPLVGMAKGQIPFNADMAKRSGTRMAQAAPMLADAFRMDTREFNLETGALDKIWDNQDDFKAKAQDLVDATAAFAAAAASGDEKKTMKTFGDDGGACKGCHDEYRAKD